jgi:indolepyruvate ferredoxin oxidoreductase alpha subunit
MVLDNRWTAMTGHQPSPTTGRVGDGRSAVSLDIVETSKALGVKNVLQANAFDVKSVKEAVEKAWTLEGAVIVVISGECRLQWLRQHRKDVRPVTKVDPDRCNGCGICLQLGCPALGVGPGGKETEVDQLLCSSCGLCVQVCARQAISAGPVKTENVKAEGGAR